MAMGKCGVWTCGLLLLVAAPCAAAGARASDDLVIEAGRLHAMLGKSEQLLKLEGNEATASTSDTVRETNDPFLLLKDAVIRYDRDLSDACRMKLIAGPMCNDLLAPWWLASRTLSRGGDLQAMIGTTSRHIASFWKEACRVRETGSDPSLCEIE